MSQTNTKIATGVAVIIAILIVAGMVYYSHWQISGSGIVASSDISIYSDSSLLTTIKSIEWGKLYPGDIKGVNIWIKPTGTENIKLILTVKDWNPPAAAQYLTIGWNYTTGTILTPGTAKHYLITLTVSPTVTGINTFTHNIAINSTSV